MFSHILTDLQYKELKEKYRCENIIYMSEDLKKSWMSINDTSSPKIFEDFILKNLQKGDYVLIQGDWGMTYKLITFAKRNGFIPIFSRTARNVREQRNGDQIIKTSVFEHIGFRKYEE